MQYRSIETKSGYWAVTVDDFRELLDIPDSYRMSHIDSRVFNTAKKELLNSKDGRPPIFDSLSIEKIKAKKGNKIQRFVIRFKEYEDPNPVPMINFMTGEEI
jgi:plasmid replication initiation protein